MTCPACSNPITGAICETCQEIDFEPLRRAVELGRQRRREYAQKKQGEAKAAQSARLPHKTEYDRLRKTRNDKSRRPCQS